MWAFLILLVSSAGLVACVSDVDSDSGNTATSVAAVRDRPNIIFLLTDDQRADSLSSTGHPFSQTPNIDQLAKDGIRFTNAFTVEPICAPSRFAFLSGQYERTSGLGFNSPYQVVESQWQQTYPALLRGAGYFTGFIGKFGVQFYSFDGSAASKFDYWKAHDGWLPFFPKDLPDNPATEIYKNAQNDITTEIMGEYIEEFLDTRPENVPFNLSVSFSAPHNSVVSTMYTEGADPDCES
ncbi:MAG: sulfatase-like hydrolase/transferase, partial [Desulfobacteraceae bacterium]|nr:sulfatase-like hydrolase/transferase [Desulfobacteraceae bacterium]